jgi:hypothetical protein
MRKLVWMLAFLILVSATSVLVANASAPCTDTDNGPTSESRPEPFISELGVVKYGITDRSDECISNDEGYHLDPSSWVREYYCGGNPVQRLHTDVDCTRYGYTGCSGGKCVGKENASRTREIAEGPKCGNKRLDPGEQCDPPDKICYVEGNIGVCTRETCQCKLYKPKSGAEPAEQPPAATTSEPKPEEQPQASQHAASPAAEQPPAATPTEQPPTAAERTPLPTEFESAKGISVTRSITNSVKRFFSWIAGWFS